MDLHQPESRGFVGGVIIAGMSLLLAACFEYFVFGHRLGLGFPLFVLLVLAGTFGVVGKKRFDPELLWAIIPLLFFSWMMFVRASVLLTILNVVACLFLFVLLLDLFTGKKLRYFVLVHYVGTLVLPLRFLKPLGRTLSAIASMQGVHRHSEVVSQVVKGICMAIPVLILFAFLFASADLLFHKYIAEMLSLKISEETIGLLARFVIVTCAFIGGLSYVVYASKDPIVAASSAKKKSPISIIELSIFLGAINLLFLCFILIQLIYLFGGAENITAQGFTYAQYARKGFFELIFVAIFSFVILWWAEQSIVRTTDSQHHPTFKVFGGLLILQVIVIMISAFTRLSLYESAYGFTTLRLYSHAFIILLSAVFLLLLYKICLGMKEHVFAHGMFLAVTLFLVSMNLLNPDAFIARQNIRHFEATPDKLDVGYLAGLSEDALPVTIDLLLSYDEQLIHGRFDMVFMNNDPWQATNLARDRAKDLLDGNLSVSGE